MNVAYKITFVLNKATTRGKFSNNVRQRGRSRYLQRQRGRCRYILFKIISSLDWLAEALAGRFADELEDVFRSVELQLVDE